MITSEGAVLTRAEYGRKLYRQANRNVFWCAVVFLICGAVFPALCIFKFDVVMLIAGVVLLIGGAFFLVLYFLGDGRKFATAEDNTAELYRDYMVVTEGDPSAPSSVQKVYYSTLVKCRESRDYFLAYVTNTTFFPVGKDGLTAAECNLVRRLLGLPVKADGAEIVLPPTTPSAGGQNDTESDEEKEKIHEN